MSLRNLKQAPCQIHEDEYLRGDDLLCHTIGGSKKQPSGSVDTVYSSTRLQLDTCAYMPRAFFP